MRPSKAGQKSVEVFLVHPGSGREAHATLSPPRKRGRAEWSCRLTLMVDGQAVASPEISQVSAYLSLQAAMGTLEQLIRLGVRRLGGPDGVLIDGMEADITFPDYSPELTQ